MATKKKYGYYIKGNKLAIIQQEDTLAGSSNDQFGLYKSPVESVTDGLEIQYAYTPTYRINDADDSLAVSAYTESSGLLSLTIPSSSFEVNAPIVITGSEKWNGLHVVNAATSSSTSLVLKTKYNGGSVTEAFTLLKDVSVLQDETFELDLSRYQANAVVYYLKAKMAEDAGDFDRRQFFMREFKKQLEKGVSALKRGPYIMQGFKEMT